VNKAKRHIPSIPNQMKDQNQGGQMMSVPLASMVPDTVNTPPGPETVQPELANVPLEELGYECCGLCAHRTTIRGMCSALPAQIVPFAIVPAPVKVLTPGSMPPMLIKSKPMRLLVGERDSACGLFSPLTEEEKAQRTEVRARYQADMEAAMKKAQDEAEAKKAAEGKPAEEKPSSEGPTPAEAFARPPFTPVILGSDGKPLTAPCSPQEEPQAPGESSETPQ
jgi:hypothetical protein